MTECEQYLRSQAALVRESDRYGVRAAAWAVAEVDRLRAEAARLAGERDAVLQSRACIVRDGRCHLFADDDEARAFVGGAWSFAAWVSGVVYHPKPEPEGGAVEAAPEGEGGQGDG